MSYVRWGDYELYEPVAGVDRPLGELPIDIARAEYENLMSQRFQRLRFLERLLQENGVPLDAPDWLDRLEEWYVEHVEEDAAVPGRLSASWYSVATDIGLLLGERLIAATGGVLRWVLNDWGKRRRGNDIAYQWPVLVGFPVADSTYNREYAQAAARVGHHAIADPRPEGTFRRMYETSLALALHGPGPARALDQQMLHRFVAYLASKQPFSGGLTVDAWLSTGSVEARETWKRSLGERCGIVL